mmetsp:Transcript_16973/g.35633  ORF Transcript_16973/g.35633 Transcript_16973/m.35633 type:complete len:438 (-) Transcript_16973:2005-3318(-)
MASHIHTKKTKDGAPPMKLSPPLPWLSRTFSSISYNTSPPSSKTNDEDQPTLSTIDLKTLHTSPAVSPSQILLIGLVLFALTRGSHVVLLIAYALSRFIPYAFRINDDGETRRKLWNNFVEKGKKGADGYPTLPKEMRCDEVNLEENYWVNDRGMCLLTSIMTPKDGTPLRAVVCYCHGFLGSASLLARCEYQRFVKAGIAVVSTEYEGHGRSDGLLGLVPCWNKLIDDTSNFFEETCKQRFSGLPCFLNGESMGGAVAFSTYERNPKMWNGVIFVAPMVKIADDVLPSKWVIDAFRLVVGPSGTSSFLARLPIAPSSGSFDDFCFKEIEKRELVNQSPYSFGGRKPRLATARELMNTTAEISSKLHKFDAPFLVQHGLEDRITCPKLSECLYEESKSSDKEIKLYKGMWHTITAGEPDHNIDLVFNDAIKWVIDRL